MLQRLKIHLFGRPSLEVSQKHICLSSAKAQELLCFLLLHPDRDHPREFLASLLWANGTVTQVRKHLRQSLWQLQSALSKAIKTDRGPLEIARDSIRLKSQASFWLDIKAFEQLFEQIRGTPGEKLGRPQARDLQHAVSLYRGDLLDGWYQEWCFTHRQRFLNIYLCMLDKLMGHCEATRRYEEGVRYGEISLQKDRANEVSYFRLMRLRYLAGDRAGALRYYQHCESALREELGVTPAKSTLELYQQIRADQMGALLPQCDDIATITARSRSLLMLRSLLLDLEKSVHTKISDVDRVLHSIPNAYLPRKS